MTSRPKSAASSSEDPDIIKDSIELHSTGQTHNDMTGVGPTTVLPDGPSHERNSSKKGDGMISQNYSKFSTSRDSLRSHDHLMGSREMALGRSDHSIPIDGFDGSITSLSSEDHRNSHSNNWYSASGQPTWVRRLFGAVVNSESDQLKRMQNLRSHYRERRLVRRKSDAIKAFDGLTYYRTMASYYFEWLVQQVRRQEVVLAILIMDMVVDFTLSVLSAVEIEQALSVYNGNPFLIQRAYWLYVSNLVLSFYVVLSFFGKLVISVRLTHIILNWMTFIDLLTVYPILISLWFPYGQYFNVPMYLRCWPFVEKLKVVLYMESEKHPNVFDRLSVLLVLIAMSMCAYLFTAMCLFQNLELMFSGMHYGFVSSLYFIAVTFSTVGYGDISPTNPYSKIAIICSILIAIIYFPRSIQQILETYQVKKQGQSVHIPGSTPFIVLTLSYEEDQTFLEILDSALMELTANRSIALKQKKSPYEIAILGRSSGIHDSMGDSTDATSPVVTSDKHRNTTSASHLNSVSYQIVVLATQAPSNNVKAMLASRVYASRITFIQGSSHDDGDLARVAFSKASACFVIADRAKAINTDAAFGEDNETVLKVWGMKRFAPRVPLYVTSLKPETNIHINPVCRGVVCMGSLRQILLGYSSMYKGGCAVITNLVHTSKPLNKIKTAWHSVYADSVNNKIITAPFNDLFCGKKFAELAWFLYAEFQVILVGLRMRIPAAINLKKLNIRSTSFNSENAYTLKEHVVLNPGSDYVIPASGCIKDLIFIANSFDDVTDLEFMTPEQFMSIWEKWNPNNSKEELLMKVNLEENMKSGEVNCHCLHHSVKNQEDTISNANNNHNTLPNRHRERRNSEGTTTEIKYGHKSAEGAMCLGHPWPPHHIARDGHIRSPLCHLLRVPTKKADVKIHTRVNDMESLFRNGRTNLQDHIILCTSSYDVWTYLCSVRLAFINADDIKPVLILCPNAPTEEQWRPLSVFPKVYYMQGSPLKRNYLIKAGLFNAYCVIVMKQVSTGQEAKTSEHLADSQAIMATHQIDFMARDKYVITELISKRNIKYMRAKFEMLDQLPRLMEHVPFPCKPIDITDTLKSFSHSKFAYMKSYAHKKADSTPSFGPPNMDGENSVSSSDEETDDTVWVAGSAQSEIPALSTTDPAFYANSAIYASGRVLAGDMYDSLIFEEFKNPGLVKVIKLLCGMHYKEWNSFNEHLGIKGSVMKQIRVPKEFAGQTFSFLFKHLALLHGFVPLAIYRDRAHAGGFSRKETKFNTAKQSTHRDEKSPEFNSTSDALNVFPLGEMSNDRSVRSFNTSHLFSLQGERILPRRTSSFASSAKKEKLGKILMEELEQLLNDANRLDNELPFVITNPLPDFIIDKRDKIFVLML
ncbi:hypothetical protein MP638_001711 [Amoeboaphelidium occidentale]|nr:hypothetical protein MP638_001711 [Amoeboaphelidium occidentale]